MKITNEIVESFYECQYKAYLKLQDLRGEKCNLEKLLINESKHRRSQFCRMNLNRAFPRQAFLLATKDANFDNNFFANVEIRYENFQLKCDFLKKVTTHRAKAAVSYVPTLIVPTDKVSKKNKILITAVAYVMGKSLQLPVEYGIIVNSADLKSTKVRVRQHLHELDSFVAKVQQNEEPLFRLNSHCTVCEFTSKCKERATKEDHLSLLKGVSPDKLKKLNKKGIFTVNQLSYTFRPKRKPLVNVQRNSTRSFELQALAIREKKIFVYDVGDELPQARTEMFLDVEGLPDRNFYYLIGLTIKTPESLTHHSYWLNDPNDAREVAEKFLQRLADYSDFVIYHFGAYEVEFLRSLKKVCGNLKEHVDGVVKRCFNILSLIYTHIYFPTYSNGLKEIGQLIGFKWTDEKSSGTESIFWRGKWELKRDEFFKQKLTTYNREDCSVLMVLKEVIGGILSNNSVSGFEVSKVSDLLRKRTASFVVNHSFFPEMKFINECAYFDFQREKVYSKSKCSNTRPKQTEKRQYFYKLRPSKTVLIEAPCCQSCGSKRLSIKKKLHRKIADLMFTNSGVRRFIVQYYSREYQCKICKKTFVPDGYPTNKFRTGHNLMVWGIYQHIVNKQSFRVIEESFHELFNVYFSKTTFFTCKSYFVKYYESSFDHLKAKVLDSDVLYVDETPFNLQFTKGYVWVLTNGHEVISVYRPTREANFIKDLLKNFKGVLVTDFYTGYDGVDCLQQRCLIHLIRDFNSDLILNPFNDEFKQIAKSFTALLQGMVSTANTFGLRKYYLKKHKRQASAFLLKIKSTAYKTEIAQQYQIRIKKNEDRLFEFLNHDNVAWNNNNAEHAIKILAMHANKDMNTYRETRIADYLKIMSIYQTCKLKKISFLKFLLSKETNIDKYVENSSRKKHGDAVVAESCLSSLND